MNEWPPPTLIEVATRHSQLLCLVTSTSWSPGREVQCEKVTIFHERTVSHCQTAPLWSAWPASVCPAVMWQHLCCLNTHVLLDFDFCPDSLVFSSNGIIIFWCRVQLNHGAQTTRLSLCVHASVYVIWLVMTLEIQLCTFCHLLSIVRSQQSTQKGILVPQCLNLAVN